MILYNKIGKNYNKTRAADPRIVKQIIKLLNCLSNKIIVDIGAGTGNYSYELGKKGYNIYALEPSDIMYKQRSEHKNIKWYKGFAENMSFKDNFFDSAICILSSHHFTSLEKSIKEIERTLKDNGTLLLFTSDPRKVYDNCWLKEYFKLFYIKACETLPSCKHIEKLLEKQSIF